MTLTRRAFLGAAGAVGAALATPALPRERLVYDLAPVEVADGIHMIEGSTDYFDEDNGGAIVNVVFVETDAGAIVVDTGSSLRYGEALLRVVRQTLGKGIAEVILTHHHPDHFLGNQAFEGIPIRALGKTRDLIAENGDTYADALYRLLGDWMRGTQPVPPSEVIGPGSLLVGGRTLTAMPMAGHTEADLVLLDHRTGVVIAGDVAFLDRAPTMPDADLAKWRESLAALEALEPAAVVPGHGPFDRERRSLAQTRAYIDWLEATLKDAAGRGLDMVETMALPIPDRFAAMGAQPGEFERSVVHLFPAFETAALPLRN